MVSWIWIFAVKVIFAGRCFITVAATSTLQEEVAPPEPHGFTPNERQAFIHFNMNTFTGNEWGSGSEGPKTFNPTALDESGA
jgi:alpha-L-fucosidase